ncbi:MAG TPA: dienelactone hydrolase family protein [Acidimicrobiia bacterium]|nr:dienelactone hydrolase family protein [Acidimicrobiia bacterium]
MFDGMEPMELEHEGTLLRGYAAQPNDPAPAPAVLVMHSALGVAHGVNERAARKLAALGYVAVCTDMYGAHLVDAGIEDAGAAYAENLASPEKQRARTVAWFDEVARRPDVDDTRIAAIGFCYGGMTVLELARSGADLKAAVSYHGILQTHARAERGAVRAHVVAYCGAGDPYAPLMDIDALRKEMLDADVEQYQVTVFGGAGHGFTDPEAGNLELDGVAYDELSNDLSWNGTVVLLDHVFRR